MLAASVPCRMAGSYSVLGNCAARKNYEGFGKLLAEPCGPRDDTRHSVTGALRTRIIPLSRSPPGRTVSIQT